MQGNSHVRFGERRVETGRREVARRYAPTLPALPTGGLIPRSRDRPGGAKARDQGLV